jgi:general secretion pathway protein G
VDTSLNLSSLQRKERGFTLVELLVVIAIIGILATLVLLQLSTARAKARDTQRITGVSQIRDAVEQYYDDNGSYPVAITAATLGTYLTRIPTDPSTGAAYGYEWDPAASPVRYQVWAELETKASGLNNDSDVNSTAWAGAGNKINGATEACTAAANDCIYDLGHS